MKIISNISNVSANFAERPFNFQSNNVQTIINDPIVPQCNCNICIFYDFCSGCYFNPCDNIIFYNCMPFPQPINHCFKRRCQKFENGYKYFRCVRNRNTFCRKRYKNNRRNRNDFC